MATVPRREARWPWSGRNTEGGRGFERAAAGLAESAAGRTEVEAAIAMPLDAAISCGFAERK